MINRGAVKTLIQLYVDMGKEGGNQKPVRKDGRFFWQGDTNLKYYTNSFETPFLSMTEYQFSNKATQWFSEYNVEMFLTKVLKAIK